MGKKNMDNRVIKRGMPFAPAREFNYMIWHSYKEAVNNIIQESSDKNETGSFGGAMAGGFHMTEHIYYKHMYLEV